MAISPFAATYTAGRALAGSSSARQAPDRKWGAAITNTPYSFLSFFSEYMLDEAQKPKAVRPLIKSRLVATLTPEVFDSEYSPRQFRVAADLSGIAAGDSASITIDSTDSIIAGDVLQYMDITNPVMFRVASVTSSTVLAIKVISVANGGTVTIPASTDQKLLTRLAPSYGDGSATIADGYQKEMIRRTNYLQASIWPITQGWQQSALALQGSPTGEGVNGDWERRKQELRGEALKMRNDHMILSAAAVADGSGSDLRYISKGLLGWASETFNNTGDGSLTYENFEKVHLDGAFGSGNSSDMYFLCGKSVIGAINQLMYLQNRNIDKIQNEFGIHIIKIHSGYGTVHLVRDDAMNQPGLNGVAISFDPKRMERVFLRGNDFKFIDDRELSNFIGDRGAWTSIEALMSAGSSVRVHTNILRAAA